MNTSSTPRARRRIGLLAGGIAAVLSLTAGVANASSGGVSTKRLSPDPQSELSILTDGLKDLTPYITGEPGEQSCDSAAALDAGLDLAVVELGVEIVASQNEFIASGETDVTGWQSTRTRPAIDHLNDVATAAAAASTDVIGGVDPEVAPPGGVVVQSVPGVSPCGEYAHPIPSFTPTRVSQSPGYSIESFFGNLGFHETLGYACGSTNYRCASDWTRGRSYFTTTYGTCSSPRFRDQGYETGTKTGWIQYGEPNPEVTTYTWPYWNWQSYVQWWHSNY